MAPAEMTEGTSTKTGTDRAAPRHEGINSNGSRGFSSPVLGDDDRTRTPHAHTGFASAGGWVVSR